MGNKTKQTYNPPPPPRCESAFAESPYLCRPPHSQQPERRIVVIRREANPMEAVASLRETAADRQRGGEASRGFYGEWGGFSPKK